MAPDTVSGAGVGDPHSANAAKASSMPLKLRAKEEAYAALVKTNSETFRLSNDGRFPAKVSLAFEQQPQVRKSREKDG